MTAAAAEAHQLKHFGRGGAKIAPVPQSTVKPKSRQNKTEAEYGLILEAMKRRDEILDYRPFGIKLEWGADPKTGKPMVYSPDFTVFNLPNFEAAENLYQELPITFIEVKGGYIHPQDWIRFKGCRAEWSMFIFELHQKTPEGWRKLL